MYHLHSTSCGADGLALFEWKLWGGLACPLVYFCLWDEMIVEWSGRFLYTGKHAELRGGYAGIFLHKFGVSCQIRICDVTAKMLLVRGKAPETPDNVKWRQILPSLLIYDGTFCRHDFRYFVNDGIFRRHFFEFDGRFWRHFWRVPSLFAVIFLKYYISLLLITYLMRKLAKMSLCVLRMKYRLRFRRTVSRCD